jgi:hypothetical protein
MIFVNYRESPSNAQPVSQGTCQQIMPLVLSSNALVTAEKYVYPRQSSRIFRLTLLILSLWVSMETRLGIKAVDPHLPLTPTPRHPPARRLPPLATALSLQDQSYNPSAHLQLLVHPSCSHQVYRIWEFAHQHLTYLFFFQFFRSLRAPARAQQAQA